MISHILDKEKQMWKSTQETKGYGKGGGAAHLA